MNTFEEKWKNNKDLAFNETLREGSKIQRWILERNGFSSLANFKNYIQNKHKILDAGCGNGRVTALMASCSPNAIVISVDLYPTVARENLYGYKNALVVRGDIQETVFSRRTFDFIYCQEVLHHLEDPFKGFQNLCSMLEPDGVIAIYVYKKKSVVREFVDEYVRERLSDDDYKTAIEKLKGFSELGKELQKIKKKVKVPNIELLEIPEGEYGVHELFYNFFCKCYFNSELGLEGSNAVNFDWYHPTVSTKHTEVEVEGWLKKCGLE